MQHAQIVLHILLPPYQTPKPVQPRVSALHHPAPSTVSGYVHTRTLLFPTSDVGGVTPLSHQLDPWVVITFVQTLRSVGEGLCVTIDSRVASTSLLSCRFAPSTATPMGMPLPSSTQTVTPNLPRSVGCAQWPHPPSGHGSLLLYALESIVSCSASSHSVENTSTARSGHALCSELQTPSGAPSTGSLCAARRRCRSSTCHL